MRRTNVEEGARQLHRVQLFLLARSTCLIWYEKKGGEAARLFAYYVTLPYVTLRHVTLRSALAGYVLYIPPLPGPGVPYQVVRFHVRIRIGAGAPVSTLSHAAATPCHTSSGRSCTVPVT